MLGVLLDSDVEEGGVEPLQSDAHVRDGVQHYLCIQVLYQVMVEAGREGREGGREERGSVRGQEGGEERKERGSGRKRGRGGSPQLSIICLPPSRASYLALLEWLVMMTAVAVVSN